MCRHACCIALYVWAKVCFRGFTKSKVSLIIISCHQTHYPYHNSYMGVLQLVRFVNSTKKDKRIQEKLIRLFFNMTIVWMDAFLTRLSFWWYHNDVNRSLNDGYSKVKMTYYYTHLMLDHHHCHPHIPSIIILEDIYYDTCTVLWVHFNIPTLYNA